MTSVEQRANPWLVWAMLGLVVVVLIVGAVVLRSASPDRDCSGMGSSVEDFDGFRWDNGITSSGSEWISVLTDGITEVHTDDRADLAAAVQEDQDGYERFRDALDDPRIEAAADRLRSIAINPEVAEASADDPDVVRDAARLHRLGLSACNLA